MAYVEVSGLTKRYRSGFLLDGISFELEEGETMTLLGPSGSGKTSLIRNICGLERPDSGTISLAGRNVTEIPAGRRNVGMIFQDLALFPHMTVYDNIAFGIRNTGMSEGTVRDKVTELADLLRIGHLTGRRPGEISGGEKQRVALARSVAPSPQLLLLDEPMSSLDMQLRGNLRSEFKAFARKRGLTMIYITHDHHEGFYMADRAGLMFSGRLESYGKPEALFKNPDTVEKAKFLGYNIISIGGRIVAFHPSEFMITGNAGDVTGRIRTLGFEGEIIRVHLVTESGEMFQIHAKPGELPGSIAAGSEISIEIPRRIEIE